MTSPLASTEEKALSSRGALPRQFEGSAFDDEIWYLPHPASGAVVSLNWGAKLEDGSLLTDERNRTLLLGCKTALILYAEGKSGRRPRAGAIRILQTYLLMLVIWMTSRKLSRFDQLTMPHVIGYRNHVQRRYASMGGTARRMSEKLLSSRTQRNYLDVIITLAKFQRWMLDLGTTFSDAEVRELSDLIWAIRSRIEQPTRTIPDDKFVAILTGSIDWLRTDLSKVLRLETARVQLRAETGQIRQKRRRERYLHHLSNGTGAGETIQLDGVERELSSITYREALRLVTLTRAACFIVIAALTGMRACEILSIREGCLKVLPIRGRPSVLKLCGTLYKTSRLEFGEPAEWVGGWDEPENPIRLAASALERLPRLQGSSGLFASTGVGRSKKCRQDPDRIALSSTQGLVQSFADARGVTGWAFSPHQFRKTFARFVAVSGSASVLSLMRHFKHASILMTDRYMPNDPELLNEIIEASEAMIAERLDSVFGATALGGLGGARIIAGNGQFRGTAGAKARRDLVEMTLRDPAAHFRVTSYGLCIYDEPQARCRGDVADVGLATCIQCNNFATDSTNLPFWLELHRVLQEATIEQARYGIVNVELHRQIGDCEKMISALGGVLNGR